MKRIKVLLLITIVILSSCGKEDIEKEDFKELITGKWERVECSGDLYIISFNPDGTGYDDIIYDGISDGKQKVEWKINGSLLQLIHIGWDSYDYEILELNKTTLRIKGLTKPNLNEYTYKKTGDYDSDKGITSNLKTLSPPSWIQGTWEGDFAKAQFTKDNVIFTVKSQSLSMTINLIESANRPNPSPDLVKIELIEKIKTDSEYEAGIRTSQYGNTADGTYKFRKISSTQIEYVISNLSDEPIIVLDKK